MKVLLVDDHFVVRQGVFLMLTNYLKTVTIYQAETISEAYNGLNNEFFDLLILDVHFPKGSSLELLHYTKTKAPKTKILILSGLNEEQYAIRYIQAGADGYLNKMSSEKEIHNALNAILENKKYISKVIKEKITESILNKKPLNKLEILSNREMEVARLLSGGEGNLEIANRLNLSTTTVSTYKYRIFEKLKVTNVISLVSLFKIYDNGN
ncbi:response regulator transcription factor [Galbibacter sp. PAP.153]|uniref:response regulator transcription factor n=1 Tax=Galbibacter sp. PAP.153 TaxID=3104623 RepID=UPI00300ACD2F